MITGQPLRVIFAGTPDFAANHLAALIDSHHQVIAAYSQPDRPAGRGKKLQASPVKIMATEHNIPVYQPETLKDADAQAELAALKADIMIVVAYGLILPMPVLNAPSLGCINVHGSLLPKWRGAAPIQRSIWAGDSESGVTIMQMDEGLDTGAMLYKHTVPIAMTDTIASLYQKLAETGPKALIHALNRLNELAPQKQTEAFASYAKKLTKQEAMIDWLMDAEQIERNIRAFNPWPMAWFKLGDQSIKVWAAIANKNTNNLDVPGTIIRSAKNGISVATAAGAITFTQLQLPGKKALDVADILNSKANLFGIGTRLL